MYSLLQIIFLLNQNLTWIVNEFHFCLASSHLQECSPSRPHIHSQAVCLLLILLSREVFLSCFLSLSTLSLFLLSPPLLSSLPFLALVFFRSFLAFIPSGVPTAIFKCLFTLLGLSYSTFQIFVTLQSPLKLHAECITLKG